MAVKIKNIFMNIDNKYQKIAEITSHMSLVDENEKFFYGYNRNQLK